MWSVNGGMGWWKARCEWPEVWILCYYSTYYHYFTRTLFNLIVVLHLRIEITLLSMNSTFLLSCNVLWVLRCSVLRWSGFALFRLCARTGLRWSGVALKWRRCRVHALKWPRWFVWKPFFSWKCVRNWTQPQYFTSFFLLLSRRALCLMPYPPQLIS